MRLAVATLGSLMALAVFAGVVAAATILHTVPVSATANIVLPPVAEDVDGDGCVGYSDLALVAGVLDQAQPFLEAADVNGDGVVDVEDLAAVAASLGTRTHGDALCP